jgi:hypothetical protein
MVHAASTIHDLDRHAYGANVGWIDARADGDHGVRVGEFVCTGYLYAANAGWINMGDGDPADGVQYRNDSAADFGVNRNSLGELSGYAWAANIGWLVFTNRALTGAIYDPPRVDVFTGRFSGYVFSPNVGWMTLSNLFAHVKTDAVAPSVDSDGDGIPDAWELSQVDGLNVMTGTSNHDHDLTTDLEEYLADTDPLTAGDELRITGFVHSADAALVSITWATRPTRVYRLLERPEVGADLTVPWLDVGLGWVTPDPGGTTTRTMDGPPADQRYLRIEAGLPLAR